MPDRKRKPERETPHKDNLCKTCGRPFAWKKQWERDWDIVKYCSDNCRGYQSGEKDAALEAAILELLAERGRDQTICPSDAAKKRWRRRNATRLGGVDGACACCSTSFGRGREGRHHPAWADC